MEEKYVVVKNGHNIKVIYDSPKEALEGRKRYADLTSHPNKNDYTAKAILVPENSTIYRKNYYSSYQIKTLSPLYKEKHEHLVQLMTNLDELKIRHGIQDLEEEIEAAQKEETKEVQIVELNSMFMRDLPRS